MTTDMVVALSRQAIELALFLALPMLGVATASADPVVPVPAPVAPVQPAAPQPVGPLGAGPLAAGIASPGALPPMAPVPAAGSTPGANVTPTSFSEAFARSSFADQEALDAALQALPDELIQGQMETMLTPLRAMLNNPEQDSQAMLGWLAEKFPAADDSTLQNHLTKLIFAAQVWGRLNG